MTCIAPLGFRVIVPPSILKLPPPVRMASAVSLPPNTAPNASMRMDFPAPVSPVRILSPAPNSTPIFSSRAKFCAVKDINMTVVVPFCFWRFPALSACFPALRAGKQILCKFLLQIFKGGGRDKFLQFLEIFSFRQTANFLAAYDGVPGF